MFNQETLRTKPKIKHSCQYVFPKNKILAQSKIKRSCQYV